MLQFIDRIYIALIAYWLSVNDISTLAFTCRYVRTQLKMIYPTICLTDNIYDAARNDLVSSFKKRMTRELILTVMPLIKSERIASILPYYDDFVYKTVLVRKWLDLRLFHLLSIYITVRHEYVSNKIIKQCIRNNDVEMFRFILNNVVNIDNYSSILSIYIIKVDSVELFNMYTEKYGTRNASTLITYVFTHNSIKILSQTDIYEKYITLIRNKSELLFINQLLSYEMCEIILAKDRDSVTIQFMVRQYNYALIELIRKHDYPDVNELLKRIEPGSDHLVYDKVANYMYLSDVD